MDDNKNNTNELLKLNTLLNNIIEIAMQESDINTIINLLVSPNLIRLMYLIKNLPSCISQFPVK